MDAGYIVTAHVKMGIVPRPKKIKSWHRSLESAKRSIEYSKKLQLYKNSRFEVHRPGEGLVEII